MSKLTQTEINERLLRLRNLEVLYGNQTETIKKLKEENKRLKLENQQLKDENKALRERVAKLELIVEDLQKMIFKKTKKDKPAQEASLKEKTISKVRTKESYRRPIPSESQVTIVEDYSVERCGCGNKLINNIALERYIEDVILPKDGNFPLKKVTKQIIEKGYCDLCKKRTCGTIIPSQECLLGSGIKAFVVYAISVLQLSYQQLKNFLQTFVNTTISDGEIVHILQKEAIRLTPEYEAMKIRIQNSIGVHYDETSRPVQSGNEQRYGWIMTPLDGIERIYLLGTSRGAGNLELLKGNSKAVGISDDYGAYKNAFEFHQLCRAHPIRKLRDLATSHILLGPQKQQCCNSYDLFRGIHKKIVLLLNKSGDDLTEDYEQLIGEFNRASEICTGDPAKLVTIKNSLQKNREKYFTCLFHHGVPTTNNTAERNLRSLVIKRKLSFGSKTSQGTNMMEKIYSIVFSLLAKSHSGFFDRYLAI